MRIVQYVPFMVRLASVNSVNGTVEKLSQNIASIFMICLPALATLFIVPLLTGDVTTQVPGTLSRVSARARTQLKCRAPLGLSRYDERIA